MEIERYNVEIGTNRFHNTPCAIGYQEEPEGEIVPLLEARIRDSDLELQLSFDVADAEGNKVRVRNNVPVSVDDESRYEVIHEAKRKVALDKELNTPIVEVRKNGFIQIYGDFYVAGRRVVSTQEALQVNSATIFENEFSNCGGILLTPSGGLAFGFSGSIPPLPEVE